MAEILPAVIERRWTHEVPHPRRWRVFPPRVRQLLILLSVLMLTSGVLAGALAWWQPISAPIWVVLAISRPDTATTTRGLEIAGDAYAYKQALKPDHRAVLRDSGITRRECELLLSRLRSTHSQDRLCFYIAATVTVNGLGEVVLFPSDIGPTEVDAALPLVDLITAIANSGANRSVIWLDLSPIDSDDPEVSPVVGTGKAVEHLLKRLALNGTLVITSTAPGQTPERVPATCRSAFGLFFEYGLLGAADGCGNTGLIDGRISVNELTAYLLARVPAFTSAACGRQQTPVCYGSVPDFELSIGSTDLPALAITRNSEPYPKWLQGSWTEYQTALSAESYHADIASFRIWTSALVAAETAWCNQAPSNLLTDLQNQLADAQKRFQNQMTVVARDTLVSDTAEFRQVVQDVESFLASLEQQLESATPDQAKPLQAKLIGEFTKAHAKTPDMVIVAAILAVAEQPATSAPTPLTTLVRLLDAFPKASETDRTTLLRTLAALSERVDANHWKPEGAQKLLMIAHSSERIAAEVAHWPWTKSALDTLWSHRVSGEVLLLARGYAPIDVAWNRVQRTAAECATLQLSTTALHRACRLRGEASTLLPAHVIYAQQNAALTDTWITAAQALHDLKLGLVPPTTPPHDADDLRQMVDTLSRYSAMLQNQIDALKRPLAADMLNLAVSECQAANADAQDLIHTECLLSSPLLSAADRERLTTSYQQLADRLVATALKLDTVDDSNASSLSERSAMIASRALIAKSWQGNGATSLAQTASQQAAIQNSRDTWYTAAQRYREAQWQRVLAANQPGGKSAPAWSLADVSILGPLSCDELNRQQTRASLAVAWLARHESQVPMTVKTFSPSEQLLVTPLDNTSRDGAAVQLDLQWRGSLDTSARAQVEGFLLELTSNDRSYFAAITLPHLNDQSEVALALSSTPDVCTPLSGTIELRPSGTPQAIYVFATNTTTQARGLLLRRNGTTLGEPCTLAPQETKRLAIAALPPGLNGPVTPLHWEALDSTTMEVLGQRTYAVEVRNPADAAEVIDAQFTSDSNQGVTATVNLQALPKAANTPVDAVLVFTRSDNSLPIRILGGRLQGTLSSASGHLSLSATGMQVSPGDRLQCSVTLDGVPRVFELTGTVPPPGATNMLTELATPALSLVGKSFSVPDANYQLSYVAAAAAATAQIEITLTADDAPHDPPIISRIVPANPPPSLAWQATKPPGGLNLSAAGGLSIESFDTSGIVGRYTWHATLRDRQGRPLTTTTLPVIFDNLPPTGARFIQPPRTALKASRVGLQVSAWDQLSGINDVQLFLGVPVDGKLPAGAKLFTASPSSTTPGEWNTDVILPNEPGKTQVTAQFINGAGLSTFVTTSIDLSSELAPPAGSIAGVVYEGPRRQPKLEVVLLHAAGGEVARAMTTEDGTFTFAKLPPGEYQLRCDKATSQRKGATKVKVENGQTAQASITLVM